MDSAQFVSTQYKVYFSSIRCTLLLSNKPTRHAQLSLRKNNEQYGSMIMMTVYWCWSPASFPAAPFHTVIYFIALKYLLI